MPDDFIPDRELERRALRLLTEYENQEGPVQRPPVPIDLLIENLLDIVIDWAPLGHPDDDEQVLAAIEVTASQRRIIMNDLARSHFDQFFGTQAFSKAHEVAHAVLHLPKTLGWQMALWDATGPVTLCRSSRRDSAEIQAERFAAYLLMPEHLVRAAVGDHAIVEWPQIYQLRDAFAVSATAMRRRLEALNLAYVDRAGRVFPSREAASGQISLRGDTRLDLTRQLNICYRLGGDLTDER